MLFFVCPSRVVFMSAAMAFYLVSRGYLAYFGHVLGMGASFTTIAVAVCCFAVLDFRLLLRFTVVSLY